MVQRVVGIVMCIFFISCSVAAETSVKESILTLEQALKEAVLNSPSLKASKEEIEAAEGRRMGAVSRLLPMLTGRASWTRTNDQVGAFGTKLRQGQFTQNDFALQNLNHPSALNNFEFGLNLYMPLFASGANWLIKKSAEFEKMAALEQLSYHRRALRFSVKLAYSTISSLEEQESFIKEGIARLKKLEREYQLLRAPNSATTTSYLVSKSIRLGLESKLRGVRSAKVVAWRQLEKLMGRKPGGPVPKVEKLVLPSQPSEDGISPAKRDDYKSLLFKYKAVDKALSAGKRTYGPEIGFFTDYAVNTGDFDNGEDAYSFGVMLKWNLFQYGRESNIYTLRARKRQLNYSLMDRRNEILKAVKSSREKLNGFLEQESTMEKAFKSAEEALKFACMRYREGTLPLKDLSEAIYNWVQTRLGLAQVKFAAVSARADYDFQCGR